MTDWNAIFGESGGSSGGTNWDSIFGGGGGSKPKASSSGGGGLFGGIERFVERAPGSNIISNVVGGAGHAAANVGVGAYAAAKYAGQDITNHPFSVALGGPLGADLISRLEGGHGGAFTHHVAEPIAYSYENKYAPILQHPLSGKSYHGIEKDPFGTILDAATLATLPFTAGGSAAIRAGDFGIETGRAAELTRVAAITDKAERATALAKLGRISPLEKAYVAAKVARNPVTRTVESGANGVAKEYTVDAAKTPWGKAVQRQALKARESAPLRDVPIVGANKLAIKQFRQAEQLRELEGQSVLHQAERSYVGLKPAENEAISVIAEAPRKELINGVEHVVPRGQWLQRRIDYLEHQMEHAPDQGTKDQLKVQLDKLGFSNVKLRDKIQAAIENPNHRVLRASQGNRSVSDLTTQKLIEQGLTPEQHAERILAPAKQMNGEIAPEGMNLSPTNGATTVHGEDEIHGAPYVFSHRGPQIKGAGSWTSAKSGLPLGEAKAPDAAKLWDGIRLATGRLMTNPSSQTVSALGALRRESVDQFHQFLDTVALESHSGNIVPKGYVRYEPTWLKVDKATRERGALLESGDKRAAEKYTEDYMKQMFPKGTTEGHKTYIVPEKYAKAVEQEFTRTHQVFHLMFEKPMDFWRAAVLKWRPAWLVNNIVGQHLLYWITANPGSILSYLRVLKVERGENAAKNFLLRFMKVPELRSKYGQILEDGGALGVGVGSGHGTLGEADRFATSVRGKFAEAHSKIYNPLSTVKDIATAYPRAATKLNQEIADNWPRYARHNELLHKSDAAVRVRATAKAMGEPFTVLDRILGRRGYDEKILAEATPAEKKALIDAVNKGLGNFSTLTPFERKYMRRIFPFYAWFKVIGAVSKDLLLDSPARVNLIYNIEKVGRQNPDLIPVGVMPSWLQGALALGPAKNGVQPVLSTTGLNPFNTLPQLAQAGKGILQPGSSGSGALGLMGPAPAALDLAQGIDPFTGGTYKGPGAKDSPLVRAILGTAAGLPGVQLAQSYGYLGGKPPSKSYAPETHHLGPLNANDTLLAYLGYPRKNVRLAKAHEYAKKGY